MSDSQISSSTTSLDGALTRLTARRFLQLMIFVSIAPIAFFLIARPALPAQLTESSYQLLIFLAVAHVPITAFFWFDDRYREHINADWKTYYLIPAIIIASCALVPILFGTSGANYLFLVYFSWLLWHYGKQNWGILCLFSFGTKSPMPSASERHICTVAPIFGTLGALSGFTQVKDTIIASLLPALYWVGLTGTLAVTAATVFVVVRQLAKSIDPLRTAMTAVAGLFYLPTFVSAQYGVLAYATAHACQYFVMMYVMAGDRKQRATIARLIVITLLAIVGYYAVSSVNSSALWGEAVIVTVAIGTGITMTHFFLDSRLWRLREPFQRGAVKDSFAFLFH